MTYFEIVVVIVCFAVYGLMVYLAAVNLMTAEKDIYRRLGLRRKKPKQQEPGDEAGRHTDEAPS